MKELIIIETTEGEKVRKILDQNQISYRVYYEKSEALKQFTLKELYQEIKWRKSLHKPMTIKCWHCKAETNDWKENDLEERLCRKCYEEEQKDLATYKINWDSKNVSPEVKAIHEKEIKSCYWWCAEDCPQRNK